MNMQGVQEGLVYQKNVVQKYSTLTLLHVNALLNFKDQMSTVKLVYRIHVKVNGSNSNKLFQTVIFIC